MAPFAGNTAELRSTVWAGTTAQNQWVDNIVILPEPGCIALLGLGGGWMLLVRRRRAAPP